MKWLTFEIHREPGFRLNLTDMLFIGFLVGFAGLLYMPGSTFHWLPVYLGLSFFLFCNVFRIGSRLEIFWYVPFTLFAAYALHTDNLHRFWWLALPMLELIKWGLIAYRIWRGPYVGIAYRYLAR